MVPPESTSRAQSAPGAATTHCGVASVKIGG
jgi:hypothetical protein